MSIENRIKALRDKHAAADAAIKLLQLLPSRDDGKIGQLKRQKLKRQKLKNQN